MSGSSSLESSMVSSVLRLIPMDQYPPSSCLTFGLDGGYVIRGDRGLAARYYGQSVTVWGG